MKLVIGGHYEFDSVGDVIGRGGMGTVYRGKDTQTHTPVAIKQLRPDLANTDAHFSTRFAREASILQGILKRLNHPNIIQLLDVVNDIEEGQFLVMDYIGGGSLWDELQSTPQMPIPRAIQIAHQIASALMAIHEQGVIHRDIKPSNILMTDDKSPRLCDFGTAYSSDHTRITETGGMVGTLDYVSPEGLNGDIATASADIWAFGVMLYEMVAGVRPFPSDTPSALITAVLTKPPADLISLRPDTPRDLIRLIEWMLVKNPSERAPNMITIHQILTDMMHGAETSQALSRIQPMTGKTVKRIGILPKLFTQNEFYDREHQQAAMMNALAGYQPIISIYGRGGIGKTALASKVLADYEKTGLADGVAYLRANNTPPLNINTLLNTLGEFVPAHHTFHTLLNQAQATIRAKTESLLTGLTGGRYVVYIDNLETLQNSQTYALNDPELHQFLEILLELKGNEALSVVITTRYPLPFDNTVKTHEAIIRLDDGLPLADAISFLRQMDKQKVLPDDAQLTIWVEKVGGFPRGLEALVGYLNGGETRHIDDLLQDETLFTGEVLSNVVHQIHNELPHDFRRVLAGVGVIGQQTTRAELEYLLSPYLESGKIRLILERLVDGRFLIYNRQNRVYSLHPIDQAYILNSTPMGSVADDESAFTLYKLHQRMANYYHAQRKPQSDWQTIADLHPQLREFEHRYAIGDYENAATLLFGIDDDYLLLWGHVQLVHDLYIRLTDKISTLSLRATHHEQLGNMYWLIGNAQNALSQYESALRLYRNLGDKSSEGSALGNLGAVYSDLGDIPKAIDYLQQALIISRDMGDTFTENTLIGNLGSMYIRLGQVETAISHYQQALVLARELQNRQSEAVHLGNLGNAYRDLGQIETAITYHHQSLEIVRNTKNRRGEGIRLGNLGTAYRNLGNFDAASAHYQQAIDIAREVKDHRGEASRLGSLGAVYTIQNDYLTALKLLQEAVTITDSLDDDRISQRIKGNLALAYWLTGDMNLALTTIREAQKQDVPDNNHHIAVYHGIIAFWAGNLDEARGAFVATIRISDALIAQTPNFFEAYYTRALGYVGLWLLGDESAYTHAQTEYATAIQTCPAKGVKTEAKILLDGLLACSDHDGAELVKLLA